MSKVELKKEGPVAFLIIDNPPVNALSSVVVLECLKSLAIVAEDEEARVLIVTGAGDKAFVAGADIKEFPSLLQGQAGQAKKYALEGHKLFNCLGNFSKPTIAVINGLALGGGCELALACDIRLAADSAKLGLPEIKLGLFPGGGGTQRLPRLIGEAKAKELMYLGDPVTAPEALNIGLVNKVYPADRLREEAKKIASKLAARPGLALNLIKQAIDRGSQMSLDEGLKIEADLFDRVFLSEDVREGVTAFIEKREAKFKHR